MWESIATAPKDWSDVIVYSPEGEDGLSWVEAKVAIAYFAPEDGGCNAWMSGNNRLPIQPTHWMPLPEAPVAAQS